MPLRAATLSLAFVVLTTMSLDAQWAQFRGPNGSGVGESTGYPAEFSPSRNLAWKTAVPYGQSSPVIVGTHLYVTASDGDRRLTICLDTRTGKELWRRDVKRDRATEIFHVNDPASPTPAADESGVVAFFPDVGLVAFGPDGQLRWTVHLGPFTSFYGMAGSPIIADGLVVLVCDQQPGAFVIALDRSTGRERWRNERAGVRLGWATPIVFRPAPDRTDVVVLGSTRLDAYDLAGGTPRWWTPSGAGDALGTPLVDGDSVLFTTLAGTTPALPSWASALAQYDTDKDGRLSLAEFRGDKDYGEHFGWIDADGDGFVVEREWTTASMQYVGEYGAVAVRPGRATGRLDAGAVRWRFQKNIPYIPAPIVYEHVFYMVKTGGIITSLDAATGALLKEGRAPDALGDYYASPVAADGKVYLASTEGKITVLQAAPQWQVLAVNDIGDEIHATPALAGGRIYVRGHEAIYCFAGHQ